MSDESHVRIKIKAALAERPPIMWKDLINAFPDVFPHLAPVLKLPSATAPLILGRPRTQVSGTELNRKYHEWRRNVGMAVNRDDIREWGKETFGEKITIKRLDELDRKDALENSRRKGRKPKSLLNGGTTPRDSKN